MASARKQIGKEKAPGENPLYFDEAVQRVQEWNEALKCELLHPQEAIQPNPSDFP